MKQMTKIAPLLALIFALLLVGCDRRPAASPAAIDPTIPRLYEVLRTKETLPQVTNLKRDNGSVTANLSINGGEYGIAIVPEFMSTIKRLTLTQTENGVTRTIEMYFDGKLLECTGGNEDWSPLTAQRGDPSGVKERCIARRNQWLADIRSWLDARYPTKVSASPTPPPPSVD